MAITTKWYGTPIKNMLSGAAVFDWDTDTIKCALATATYTPNQDTDDFFNDITGELTTANGYTAGGVTMTNSAPTYDSATNQARLTGANATWTATGSGITARYAIIYKSTGTSSTSPLIGWIDFGAESTAAAGALLTIEWAANGIFYVAAL